VDFINLKTKISAYLLRHYGVNSVKKYDLTKSVFVALLLVSAVAVAEDKYPASDFQPKVVYQDEAVAKQAESSPVSKSTSSASSANDSQYPAANFEPKVVYADENYKHNASLPNSSASAQSASSASSVSASGDATAAAPKEGSSIGYLLGLIVLAAAGFFLFKKGTAGAPTTKSAKVQSVVKSSGGLTGVARYVLKSSGTGVSRYLEKNAKNAPTAAATGVAKYLASQVSSAKSTASQAATGVEKYMRNKG